MSEPTLGIVVPVLNEAAEVSERLPALLDLPADEIIFVDGGSDDGTLPLLEAKGAPHLVAPPGRAVQMNMGAAEIRSDILLFLHVDTIIEAKHLKLVKAVMRDQEVVGGRFDVRLSGRHPALRMIAAMMNLRSRLTKISTGDQAIFVRREVFARMGGFPEQPLMEDIEFSRRLKKNGKIACLRERITTSSRRWEREGILKTILLMWALRLLYWLGTPAEKLATMYRQVR